MANPTGLHHAALTVSDLDRSVAWYRDILGFEEGFREESPSRRATILRWPGGPLILGLVQHADGAPFTPTNVGLDHLAFTVGARRDLDDWAGRFAAAGVEHSPPADVPPGAILNFKDPDGIALALFWDRD